MEAEDDAPAAQGRDGIGTLAVTGQAMDPPVVRLQIRPGMAVPQAIQGLGSLNPLRGRQVS